MRRYWRITEDRGITASAELRYVIFERLTTVSPEATWPYTRDSLFWDVPVTLASINDTAAYRQCGLLEARNWPSALSCAVVGQAFIPFGMTEQQLDDYTQSVTPAIPLGRTGTTDEIAKAVAFLASDERGYITGTELFVDGDQGQI